MNYSRYTTNSEAFIANKAFKAAAKAYEDVAEAACDSLETIEEDLTESQAELDECQEENEQLQITIEALREQLTAPSPKEAELRQVLVDIINHIAAAAGIRYEVEKANSDGYPRDSRNAGLEDMVIEGSTNDSPGGITRPQIP